MPFRSTLFLLALLGPIAPADAGRVSAKPHADVRPAASSRAADLRELVQTARPIFMTSLETRLVIAHEKRMDLLSDILGYISLLGILFLGAPLVLWRRFPGRVWVIFKYGATAGVIFFCAFNVFGLLVSVLKGAQGATASATSPQIAVASALLDNVETQAMLLAPLGAAVIMPALAAMDAGSTEPLPTLMLANLRKVRGDLKVFSWLADYYRALEWMFSALPMIFTLVTLMVFVSTMKPIVVGLIRLPARAASGEAAVARRVLGDTFRRLGREGLVVLFVIFVFLVVSMVSGILLVMVMAPAVNMFLSFMMVSFMYIQAEPEVSSFLIFVCLAATMTFVLLNLVVITVSSMIYVAKVHRAFQAKFHDKVPLGRQRRLWGRGFLCMLWAQTLPFVFVFGASLLVAWLMGLAMANGAPNWTLTFLIGPAVLFLLFLLVYWAARGIKAIQFLWRYRVEG